MLSDFSAAQTAVPIAINAVRMAAVSCFFFICFISFLDFLAA